MRIYFLSLSFIVICCTTAFSQIIIKGKILDADKKAPLESVVITVLQPDSTTIINYAISDSKGEFNIEVSSVSDRYLLKASLLAFKTQIIRLYNRNVREISILLAPQVTELKEVFVKPPKIVQRHDTISYDVASYSNVQDRTIGDVLKKLPGIDIQDDGTVLYNGKAINKFYIEGLDLLDNRYGLAVNNVAPKDVQSVEILEGHQPIKALKKSTPTDRAALNLKLKKNSKARWLGHLEVAGGLTPALWRADALALKFSPKIQSLNLFQANNIGENIKTQFKQHTLEDYINGQDNQSEQTKFIKVAAENAPIADERSMLNQTFALSTNNLRLFKNDYQIKTNFNYVNDRLTAFKNSVITYYSPGALQDRIIENNSGISKQNQGNLDVNISKNTDRFYLNNKLSGQVFWNNTDVATIGSSPNDQQSRVPYHFVDNNFNFIKSFGQNRLTISSFNHLTFQPEDLNFTTAGTANPVEQRADHRDFFSNTNIAVSSSLHKWVIEYRTGIKASIQRLNSKIEPNGNELPFQDSSTNQAYWRSIDYYGSVSAQYLNDVLNFKITLPANFYNTQLNNSLDQSRENDNRFYLNPSMELNYKITSKLSVNARAELITKLLGIDYLSEGYIYQTYRNIVSGSNRVNIERRQNYALSLSYRSPVSSLFMALSASYAPTLKNQLIQRSFDNYLTIERLFPLNNDKSLWSVSGRISKGIDDIDAVASLAVTYQNATNQLLQAATVLSSENRSLQFNPKFVINFNKVVNVEYNGSFNTSKLLVANSPSTGSLGSIYQKLLVGWIVSKQLNMKAGVDQVYNQLTQTQHLSAFFADYRIQYIPAKNIALELSLKNIFNKKTIAYNLIETASNTSSIYTIRPFNALAGIRFNF
ncbi:carboxypeptidase-like regulatory domain-containing protein [Mucilaginibacter sp. RCC_168]|uniref:carboxypeptidase-like regulatory domain-containing protein n=1 Tax=Mucilaginibacter sp. RCC_168 TaxID=3239221 RepID=UPI003523A82D